MRWMQEDRSPETANAEMRDEISRCKRLRMGREKAVEEGRRGRRRLPGSEEMKSRRGSQKKLMARKIPSPKLFAFTCNRPSSASITSQKQAGYSMYRLFGAAKLTDAQLQSTSALLEGALEALNTRSARHLTTRGDEGLNRMKGQMKHKQSSIIQSRCSQKVKEHAMNSKLYAMVVSAP